MFGPKRKKFESSRQQVLLLESRPRPERKQTARLEDTRREMSVFLERQTVRRHRQWTKRLHQVEHILVSLAIVLGGLAALYGLYTVIFLGRTFTVARIVVDGKWHYLTASGLARLSGVKEGDNLFSVSVADVHRRLSDDPWVKGTVVRRRLPDTLWISVEERVPAAILAGEDFCYVDTEGNAFKRLETGEDRGFPVFSGVECAPGDDAVARARLAEMVRIADLFLASRFGRERDIAEVHYDDVKGYSLITRREPMQIFLGQAAPDERIGDIDRMVREIAGRPGRIQYMFANEPGRIIVRYNDSA